MRKNKKNFGFVQTVVTSEGLFLGTTTLYAKNKFELRQWENGAKDRVFVVNVDSKKVES